MFESRNLDFAHAARAFALSGSGAIAEKQVPSFTERAGASARVVTMIKAAVGAGVATDDEWQGALGSAGITATFISSLASQSIFARALVSGMVRVPLMSAIEIVSAGMSASIVAEGKPKPVGHLTLSGAALTRKKATGLIVLTNTLLEGISAGAVALVDAELRKAVSRALDSDMLAQIDDDATPSVASSGVDSDAVRRDILTMLAAVNTTGSPGLLFAMAPDVANRAALVDDGKGEMTPIGGRFFGVETIVSDAVATGSLVAIDTTGLAGEIESIAMRQTGAAALQMLDTPTDGPTSLISLWQSNARAIAVDTYFGITRVRDDAVAVLTDIEWLSIPPAS